TARRAWRWMGIWRNGGWERADRSRNWRRCSTPGSTARQRGDLGAMPFSAGSFTRRRDTGRGARMRDHIQTGLLALLPRLRRFAIVLTGSVADGEELLQGTCERALKKAGQARDLTRVDAWIYGIMRNLWVDELRSGRVRRHAVLDEATEVVGDDG